jgi:rhodanese-related sulfurtransferase/transcriptional regulator with XRE-family HTH domain
VKYVTAREAEALLAAGDVDLIDVREPREWATGHLPAARLVPLDVLRLNPATTLSKDRAVMFVCAKGGRSQTAGGLADQLGIAQVYSLDGGTDGWRALGLPIDVPAPAPVAPVVEAQPADLEAVMPELDAVIGGNLRELRSQRSLSLDATARLTGLSRALLGQIELGQNTPSVGVVWKIARAFEVPFAALLAAPQKVTTAVLRSDKAKRLISADGRFSSRALFPFGEANKVEFYELWLKGHAREEAEAHQPGTRENLVVTSGKLVVEFSGTRHELTKGDAIVFGADVPHVYFNPANDDCWMHLVMTYSHA